jgi:hypothetical protein
MPPKESPIPGLPLINPSTLQPQFRRFRNDALYFINSVMYIPQDEEKSTPRARVLAVTPQALFVCDAVGSMDRAVRLEQLEGLVFETRTIKKFLTKEEQIHFVIKCPSEYDIVGVFEGNKEPTNATVFKNLSKVLDTAAKFSKKGSVFAIEEVSAGQKIDSVIKKEKPQDYLSPKEIIAQNQARQRAIEYIESVNREVLELQEKINAKARTRDEKSRELKSLEAAMGSDVTEHRRRKDELTEQQRALHKQHVNSEVDLLRLSTELQNEKQRLKEEQENSDALIEQSLMEASGNHDKMVDENDGVRKRAQQRETDKAKKHLETLRLRLKVPPQYNGPEHLVQRGLEAEQKVQALCDKWEKEMETANKLEGFFDSAISDLSLLNEQIVVLVERKRELLNDRERIQREMTTPQKQASFSNGGAAALTPAPQAAVKPAGANLLGGDDDLLGGGGGGADDLLGGGAVGDGDDLLGGGGGAASPAPAVPPSGGGGGALDDDDLLGGGPSSSAPPPLAPAGDVDDGLL